MDKVLEFEFEGGGRLRLELLGGELSIRLQAVHPAEGMRTTSISVDVDAAKLEAIRQFLKGGNEDGLAR